MLPLMLAAVLAVAPAKTACEQDCDARGCWLLVYRYTVHTQVDSHPARATEMRETFDWRRFPTEEAAYCAARELRTTGVELPTLARFGRDSNVIPESITPMPHLLAIEQGIPAAHPWQESERPEPPR